MSSKKPKFITIEATRDHYTELKLSNGESIRTSLAVNKGEQFTIDANEKHKFCLTETKSHGAGWFGWCNINDGWKEV